ncbi:DoxX family protein [Leptospira stimsonii]|uniref:DoxX family protein n=1 Tax=Leptospira stimsonii TaxID=2202203 RepID=A0A8B3CM81_9LEPT|nr:DoxX family protein [Leptospira stimsonii]RHX84129.1 hypothetical protein DLM78_18785 [Leptospira stimsonii]
MFQQIFQTNDDLTLTILRVVLAIVMFPHGAQKLVGWFGGYGFKGTMGYLTGTVGVPYVFSVLVILIEFFGSIALFAGFLRRGAAFGIAIVMLGAILSSHLKNGFFMNWGGNQEGEGFEFHILAIGTALPIIIFGLGRWSVDLFLVGIL